MNDYTKNISQSIFTPGVYKQTDKLTMLSRKYLYNEHRLKQLKLKPKHVKDE